MKPSWPEFPKGEDATTATTTTTTTEEGKEEVEEVEKVVVVEGEIDYEDQHLQNAALMEEIAAKYDAWLAAKGVEDERRVAMLGRKELVEGFAREELGIYL